jgi:uncharacterized membrane protein (GlpM family)
MALTLKALVGAFIVLLISFASRSNLYYLSGLIPLFPPLALIAHFISYSDGGEIAVRKAATFGLVALVPYAIYLGVIILTLGKVQFGTSVGLAVLAWIVSAGVLIWLWN